MLIWFGQERQISDCCRCQTDKMSVKWRAGSQRAFHWESVSVGWRRRCYHAGLTNQQLCFLEGGGWIKASKTSWRHFKQSATDVCCQERLITTRPCQKHELCITPQARADFLINPLTSTWNAQRRRRSGVRGERQRASYCVWVWELVKAASLSHTPKQTSCLVAVDTARRRLLQSAKAEEVLSWTPAALLIYERTKPHIKEPFPCKINSTPMTWSPCRFSGPLAPSKHKPYLLWNLYPCMNI